MVKKFFLLLFFFSFNTFSQEKEKLKTQPSNFLANSYYSINLGGIFYPFSNDNLLNGYQSETFSNNYFSGRLLLGHKLYENLSIQAGIMRPAAWFKYDNINNIGYKKSVWITIWSLSLKKNIPLNKKLSLFAETGIANVSRVGIDIDKKIIYPDARFSSVLYGLGFNYKLSKKWRLNLNGTYIPESKKHNQPYIFQSTFGFEYHIQKLPEKLTKEYSSNGYFFPENILQVSYGTSKIGFSVNRFFGMSLKVGNFESFGIPVFWVGAVKATNVFSLTYQRLLYRSEKIFSLDWGASITTFKTISSNKNIYAFSIFPTLRFYLMRRKGFDMYTNYSILGPTFLTKANIDNLETGPKITFQDTMGLGFFLGKDRKYNLEFRIMHYSNGNFFSKNSGVAIPIQLTLGKTF